MDPKQGRLITRVSQVFNRRKTKKGIVKYGPYWIGHYQLQGKQKRVYIGQELPWELEVVLQARRKAAGKRYFAWPGREEAA